MAAHSNQRWYVRGFERAGATRLVLEFSRNRAQLRDAYLVARRSVRESVDGDRSSTAPEGPSVLEVPLSIDDRRAVATLPAALERGVFDLEIRAVVVDGRALLVEARLEGAAVDTGADAPRVVIVPAWADALARDEIGFADRERIDAASIEIERSFAMTSSPIDDPDFDPAKAREHADRVANGAREFFARIEERTSGAAAPMASAVRLVRRKLDDRSIRRAVHGAHGRVCGTQIRSTSVARMLSKWCGSFTELFRTSEQLLAKPKVEGVHRFEWAFELFVSGRLAVAHPDPAVNRVIKHHGAPDGSPFLLFSELASVCIHLDVASKYWKKRFPFLVRAAVLFATHPARDPAAVRDRGIPGASPDDLYGFYDGKVIPLADVFELRARHRAALGSLEPDEQRKVLENLLTWSSGRVLGNTNARPLEITPRLPNLAALLPRGVA